MTCVVGHVRLETSRTKAPKTENCTQAGWTLLIMGGEQAIMKHKYVFSSTSRANTACCLMMLLQQGGVSVCAAPRTHLQPVSEMSLNLSNKNKAKKGQLRRSYLSTDEHPTTHKSKLTASYPTSEVRSSEWSLFLSPLSLAPLSLWVENDPPPPVKQSSHRRPAQHRRTTPPLLQQFPPPLHRRFRMHRPDWVFSLLPCLLTAC